MAIFYAFYHNRLSCLCVDQFKDLLRCFKIELLLINDMVR